MASSIFEIFTSPTMESYKILKILGGNNMIDDFMKSVDKIAEEDNLFGTIMELLKRYWASTDHLSIVYRIMFMTWVVSVVVVALITIVPIAIIFLGIENYVKPAIKYVKQKVF